ncbi:hypothetical protein SAMN05443144_11284 [Fodinibius roseus]|uniref:Uncharacterized protein n=1 Tax=Fodinibius roseus TaxID=1194090 RepID=A0A1M5DZX6_9BACT|nr:hypothetical protein [Fodinibius roseus]SHF72519.1 hypothetical protein SAMN05443144_11284 [Fodinibius roseus]
MDCNSHVLLLTATPPRNAERLYGSLVVSNRENTETEQDTGLAKGAAIACVQKDYSAKLNIAMIQRFANI